MRAVIVGVLCAAVARKTTAVQEGAATDRFYADLSTNYWNDPCLQECFSEKSDLLGFPLQLPCAVASGKLPLGTPSLPLYFEGNYDLCQTFEQAHYCTIRTGMLGPAGNLQINQCVSKACTAEHIKRKLLSSVDDIAHFVAWFSRNKTEIVALEKLIADGLVVDCMEKRPILGIGGWSTISVLAGMLTLVLVATVRHAWLDVNADCSPVLVGCFSAKHNVGYLLDASRGTEFDVLNGLRVVCAVWIVLAHTMVNFLQSQVINPTAAQQFTQSYAFVWIFGGEYCVDTFLFISGFLAMTGLLRKLGTNRRKAKGMDVSTCHSEGCTPSIRSDCLTPSTYLFIVTSRWIRLTPVYASVLFLFWKVQPAMFFGPHWNEQFNSKGAADSALCNDWWWTNLLFVNNLEPSSAAACAPWTWYMAVDMQLFLMVPFLALFVLRRRNSSFNNNAGWTAYAPCILLVVIQIVSTLCIFEVDKLTGGMIEPGYFVNAYEKPWTRVTPYAVGIALAIYHFERTTSLEQTDSVANNHLQLQLYQEQAACHHDEETERAQEQEQQIDASECNDKHKLPPLRSSFYSAVVLGSLTFIVVLISVRYWQFRCTQSQANCNAWLGIYLLGGAVLPNWGTHVSAVFAALAWPAFSFALAAFSYALICGNDPLRTKWLLGHNLLVAPARLTYSTYLCHMPIMFCFLYSQPQLTSFNTWNIMMLGLGFVVLAFCSAFVLYIVIEKPCMNLYSLMLRGLSNKAHHGGISGRVEQGPTEQVNSEMSLTRDIDSESVALCSPLLQVAQQQQAPLVTP